MNHIPAKSKIMKPKKKRTNDCIKRTIKKFSFTFKKLVIELTFDDSEIDLHTPLG